jgi:hypothetical protein
VENKLLSFPTVQGIAFGSFREASEAVHSLVEALATSRVRVAGPQGRKGVVRTEGGRNPSPCSSSGGHSHWLQSVPSHTPCWAGLRA